MSFSLKVNGQEYSVDVDPDTPLLWVLRDALGLTGTKFGCGKGWCGACTVQALGLPLRSCQIQIAQAVRFEITTIEGIPDDDPVKQAWIAAEVPQCGYCQTGMIMTAVALLAEDKTPSDEDIAAKMTNLCRCGTYNRVRQAIQQAAKK